MPANKPLNVPPAILSAAAANILNCGITSLAGPVGYTQTQPYIIIRHIRAVNKDTAARTLTLYKGLTGGSAAGTEWAFQGTSIAANSYADWYGAARFDAADFLTGLADVANKVTLNIDAEIGMS